MISKASLTALAKALGGIPVLGSLGGSPAARAGIRYGDIVLSVNGKKTATAHDYVVAKSLRQDGMDVVFFRNGAEHTATLIFDHPGATPDVAAMLAELIDARVLEADIEGDDGAES
jgi:S1-C subfamily serine protease